MQTAGMGHDGDAQIMTDRSLSLSVNVSPPSSFLSAGQNNGFTDSVLRAWADSGAPRSLVALDLDSSDNISDEGLSRFITRYGPQLQACVLSGMTHITDQLWMTIYPIMQNIK